MLINAHIVSDYSKILLKHRVLSNRCDPLLEYPKRYTEGEALLSNILYLLDETQAEKIHTKQETRMCSYSRASFPKSPGHESGYPLYRHKCHRIRPDDE